MRKRGSQNDSLKEINLPTVRELEEDPKNKWGSQLQPMPIIQPGDIENQARLSPACPLIHRNYEI